MWRAARVRDLRNPASQNSSAWGFYLLSLTVDTYALGKLCCLQGKVSETAEKDVLSDEWEEEESQLWDMELLKHLKTMLFHKAESLSKHWAVIVSGLIDDPGMWCFYWHSVRQLLVGSYPRLLAWLRHSCRFDTMILTKIPHAWYNHSVPLERVLYLIWTKKGSAFSETWRVVSRFGSRNSLICIHLALVFFRGLYCNRLGTCWLSKPRLQYSNSKSTATLSFSWLPCAWRVNTKHTGGKLITGSADSKDETKIYWPFMWIHRRWSATLAKYTSGQKQMEMVTLRSFITVLINNKVGSCCAWMCQPSVLIVGMQDTGSPALCSENFASEDGFLKSLVGNVLL